MADQKFQVVGREGTETQDEGKVVQKKVVRIYSRAQHNEKESAMEYRQMEGLVLGHLEAFLS